MTSFVLMATTNGNALDTLVGIEEPNLTIEHCSSVSLGSTESSGSRHILMTETTGRQQHVSATKSWIVYVNFKFLSNY